MGFVKIISFGQTLGEVNPPHYKEGISSNRGIQVNSFDHNRDENEVGCYNDHHMETMLNETFRYEENSHVPGRNANAEAFYNMMHRHNKLCMKGTVPTTSFLL